MIDMNNFCTYVKDHPIDPYIIQRPFIIAEAGVNHEGSMDLAKRLVEEACQGGADAIKFQSYKADKIASKDSPAYWDQNKEPTSSQYELFKKYDVFWKNEFEVLKKYCDESSIEFMSTPFDIESATFLNDLMEVFKISSSDITNFPFIEFICGFKKPIILSTGASNLDEIIAAVDLIKKHGNSLTLMHCILNYPTDNENAHLGMILDLKRRFPEHLIGYSDHTLPGDMQILETATLLGAQVLEKHFTFDKTLPGNDHYHAMDKNDLIIFNRRLDNLFTCLGSFRKLSIKSEETSRKNARRSLIASNSLQDGQIICEADLTWKRPAFGISPRFISEVIGRKTTRRIDKDEILFWDMIS